MLDKIENKNDIKRLIERFYSGDFNSETELSEAIELLERSVNRSAPSDAIYYTHSHLTVDEMYDYLMESDAIILPPPT